MRIKRSREGRFKKKIKSLNIDIACLSIILSSLFSQNLISTHHKKARTSTLVKQLKKGSLMKFWTKVRSIM